MTQLILIFKDIKNAIKESFKELTIIGKIILAPIIVSLLFIIAISIITIGYPWILVTEKFDNKKRIGTKKIESLFYK